MSRQHAIENLIAVVPVVIGETIIKAQRLRLLAPWVEECRRQGSPWQELVEPLAPVLGMPAMQLSQRFGLVARRDPKTAANYPAWQSRIADKAGVDIPGAVESALVLQRKDAQIAQLHRILENLSVSAAGGAMKSRSTDRLDRLDSASPRTRPTPAAPSDDRHAEPSRAKAGEGGSVTPENPEPLDHRDPGYWAPKPKSADSKPPAPFLPPRNTPTPRSEEELFALMERRRQEADAKAKLPPAS